MPLCVSRDHINHVENRIINITASTTADMPVTTTATTITIRSTKANFGQLLDTEDSEDFSGLLPFEEGVQLQLRLTA